MSLVSANGYGALAAENFSMQTIVAISYGDNDFVTALQGIIGGFIIVGFASGVKGNAAVNADRVNGSNGDVGKIKVICGVITLQLALIDGNFLYGEQLAAFIIYIGLYGEIFVFGKGGHKAPCIFKLKVEL